MEKTVPTKLCVAIFLIIWTAVPVAKADVDFSWPMFQANPAHTGYVPVSLDPNGFSLKWERTVGSGKPLNPVTAADGKIFVSLKVYFNDITSLFTLDAESGETIWTKDFGRVYSVNPPSYAYGNVYIQTGNHSGGTFLRAYRANTGELVFRSAHSAQWERYYAPTIYDGKVYINGGYYGGMYAFDAYDGSRLWFKALNQYDEWTPAVDGQYAYAYIGRQYSRPAALHAIDRHSGKLAFKINDPHFDWHGWSMRLAPVIGDQNNVLVIHDGRLISFDLEQQTISWEIARSFTGQPLVAKGMIYAIDAGMLTARDETTGDLLWAWQAPVGNLTGTMILTDTHLFARTSSNVYAIDIVNHTNVWSYTASGRLALGNETLYIAAGDGTLTAITIAEAEPVNTAPVACIVGADRTIDAGSDCQPTVTLDGSCSSDADSAPGTNDDIVYFDWYKIDPCDPNFEDFLGSGEIIDYNLPLGEHIIILEVTDKAGAFDANEVTIIVEDNTPPEFTLAVSPDTLWPANHKMVLITPTWTVSDNCDESPQVLLIDITMDDEARGDGHTADDIWVDPNDGSIYLRAERSGTGDGRVYTITYQAVDESGNATDGSAAVTVPHDRR